MILAIETSAFVCSVGFYSDDKTIIEYKSDAAMQHSELVGDFIEKGLQKVGDEIHLVSVAIGPGSFTGLRIALSYAQGFCFGRDIPIVGVSNHQILAKQGEQKKETYTIIDAHRQELYFAKHKINDTMDIDYYKIIHIDKIEDELSDHCQLISLKNVLNEERIKSLSKKDVRYISAYYKTAILSEIGNIYFLAKGGQNPEELEPMYIRPFAGLQ